MGTLRAPLHERGRRSFVTGMIPVPQRIIAAGTPGDPKDPPGDCLKCCVASILELPYEAVPHFVAREVIDPNLCADGTPHPDGPHNLDWLTGLNVWLKRQGYPLFVHHWTNNLTGKEIMALRAERGLKPGEHLPANDQYHRRSWPDHVAEGYWIASVISENFPNSTHAIVMHDDQVAFDPSTKPRRTPYEFIGGKAFVCTDPAALTHGTPAASDLDTKRRQARCESEHVGTS